MGMGAMLAGGAAVAAAGYGVHHLVSGSHGGSHGFGFGGSHGFGHGKFKHGKFGKHHGGKFKKWK